MGAMAHAQAGWSVCEDPANAHSDPYIILGLSSPLFQTTLGIGGSASFIGPVCFGPYTVNNTGRFGFGAGSDGSVQSTRDDFMMYTVGMPIDPGNSFCYATINVNTDRLLYGSGTYTKYFIGTSDRYITTTQSLTNVNVDLNIDLLGDAARYEWVITNITGDVAAIGLWQGAWIGLMDKDSNRKGLASPPNDPVFIAIPGQRTPTLETIWTRKDNPAVFPPYVDLDWSQSEPYGFRIETGPSPSTTDPVTGLSDATQADVFELGLHGDTLPSQNGLLGDRDTAGPNFPDEMFPIVHTQPGIQQSDITYTDNPAYILKFDQKNVANGATREIVQYYRGTWGQSNYAPPYTVVIDAPKLFNYDPNGLNQLTPNPATVRVWVDNIKGFTSAEQEIPLQNVQITLDLNTANGLTLVGGGKTQTKTIATIGSRQLKFVDFQIQADGIATGIQTFAVKVQAPPGPIKRLTATTDISTTPKIPLVAGSNLVTFPWTFDDSSLDAIFGLSQPSQYQAYKWDPAQQGYVLATSAQRGIATWIVITNPSIIPQGYLPLNSNPTFPSDMATGAGTIQLTQGWNMIGNPYPYPMPIGDLVGVPSGDPTHTYHWSDLVSAGFVSPSMAYWDTTANPPAYKFISGNDALMQPNTGYWLYVTDFGLTLSFPPLFFEGASSGNAPSALKAQPSTRAFNQTASQFKLMISARTNDEIDDQNFVGKAANATDAKMLKIYEPPMGPQQNLGVSIGSDKAGETRLAQSLLNTTGPMQWTVYVKSNKADQVSLTWPNMTTVPKNVSFRLTDVATGTSRDMRRTSGYSFQAAANSTREFTIQAQPGTASKAIIGNVVVAQPGRGRDKSAPFTISYTLSADATTTVRILGAGGREVFTATRGRADAAGENTAQWALRDNANRAVAPGVYRVEITAETTDGQRVRKIVPVNVIR